MLKHIVNYMKNLKSKNYLKMKIVYTFLCLILLCNILIGSNNNIFNLKDVHKKTNQYVIDIWNSEDGLMSDTICAVTQDINRYIWLGTYNGLIRFNGASFKRFNLNNTKIFNSNRIVSLCSGKDGILWIGTDFEGLFSYKNGEFSNYRKKEGIAEKSIKSLIEDSHGVLWIGGKESLYKLDSGKFIKINLGKEKPQIQQIFEDNDKETIWIASMGSGLFCINNHKIKVYSIKNGLSSNNVTSVTRDAKNNLLVGTYLKGLNHLKGDKFELVKITPDYKSQDIYYLYRDRADKIWIATSKGLYCIRENDFELFSKNNGLPDNRIQSIFEDFEGNLWLGVYKGGLVQFKEGLVKILNVDKKLSNAFALSVFEDKKKNIWIGTIRSGIFKISKNQSKIYNYSSGLLKSYARCFAQDIDANVWIGSLEGISQYRNGKIYNTHPYKFKNPNIASRVLFVSQKTPGVLWIGLSNAGLFYLKEQQMKRYDLNPNYNTSSIYSIKEDIENQEILWICTSKGLIKLNILNEKKRFFTTDDGLSVNDLRFSYIDKKGIIWICTSGGGLNFLKNGKFKSFNRRHGFIDDSIWSITEDNYNNLWMSCDNGVFYVNKNEMESYEKVQHNRLNVIKLGLTDGFKSVECNGSGNPVLNRTSEQILFYPTASGVALINTKKIREGSIPPKVLIERINSGQQTYEARKDLTLPAGTKDISIHYAALSFKNAKNIQYQYKLEGYNNRWYSVNNRRVAYYTNLSPGEYTFKVIAANEDVVFNKNEACITFYLKPHFYQHPLFKFFIMFISITLVGVIILSKIRNQKKRENYLEEQIKNRTLEIKVQNDKILGQNIEIQSKADQLMQNNMELKNALSEIKHLSGLLPICAWCKRIRDDEGYWNQMEKYISHRSEAEFSHGICPECKKKELAELKKLNK